MRILEGEVVSAAMDKTVVVVIRTAVSHTKYRKRFEKTSKLKAHDPENRCQIGDKVTIRECRPLSKEKRFEVVYTEVTA